MPPSHVTKTTDIARIPNIPFFYAVYRAWSHWRGEHTASYAIRMVADPKIALKGSDHLDFILDNRLYRPVSPPKMEDLYEQVAPDAPDFHFITRSQVLDGSAPPEQIILPANSHNLVAETTGVSELGAELERALWQVQQQFKRDQRLKTQPKNSSNTDGPEKGGESK